MSLLQIKNITKNYGGSYSKGIGVTALKDVSFLVDNKMIVSIIGPNGAGKTTLFKIVLGLENANSGQIYFSDKLVSDYPPHERVKVGITCTFQIVRIFKGLTVLENVMIGRHSKSKKEWISILCRFPSAVQEERQILNTSTNVLELVGLKDKMHKIAGNLTLAEQRFVELARALAAEPSLLLLDEPTSGLDLKEIEETKNIIRSVKEKGTTVLFVEHNMDVVMDLSDRIVVLNQGEKIAEGIPETIRRDKNVLKAYLGEEFNVES